MRNLRPVTFYYNEEYSSSPERLHHGFIAQDYVKVLPDATYYDEELGKMCIDTGELIAILVRSVQQLEARVTYMEATKALTRSYTMTDAPIRQARAALGGAGRDLQPR